ncbi:MAG: putative bifunctional diguanylate cyclase/phosphodiesterase [Pseudomonadota bacterium]
MRSKFRLVRLIWPFVAIIALQAAITCISLEFLSGVRAYVAGEALWSKGQKDAIHALQRYLATGDEADYMSYEVAVAVPFGDRTARLALESNPPDYEMAREGFLRGGNHPDDVPGLIRMFGCCRTWPFVSDAVEKWRATDSLLGELVVLATTIHDEKRAGMTPAIAQMRMTQISMLDGRLAPLANAFSQSLSELSRLTKIVLIAGNVIAAALLIVLLHWYARSYLAETRAHRHALRAEQERARVILASIGDAVVGIDVHGRIDYLNPAAEKLINIDIASARQRPAKDMLRFVDSVTGETNPAALDEAVGSQATHSVATRHLLVREDTSTVPVSLVGAPLNAGARRAAGTVIVLRDMTNEIDYISRLAWQASHDTLTGLANRNEFESRLADALHASIETGERHAVAMLDLDQFKIVNDTCGHAAGDELLRQLAERLQQNLHRDELVARLGGDEFAILLRSCPIDRAALISERLRAAIEEMNFSWQGSSFSISASIGLVQVSRASLSIDDVIRAADVACYLAKDKGRNRIQLHDPNDAELRSRFGEMVWVQRIHEAFEENRFCLFAQPILALKNEEPGLHAEILIRMRDREGKLVAPGDFIAAAERYGLMPMLDRWVVQTALRTIAAAGNPFALCAINLSGATFNDEDFVDFVREQFRSSGVAPASICFEITETAAISNLAAAGRFIRALKALGCSFALDDFGAGMSSFTYLKNLPVDFIKIDGSFVKQMLDDTTDHAIVDLIARLGKVMGMRTIAEFVENDTMIGVLRRIGVDYAQGYGVSKPKPIEEIVGPLAGANPGRAVA